MHVYRLLNAEARSWWYHAQLRAQGRDAEARALERRYIQGEVQNLRAARFLLVGQGRAALYLSDAHTVEAAPAKGRVWWEILERTRPGVPRADLTRVPEGVLYTLTFAGPAYRVTDEEPGFPRPYGAFDAAPLPVYLALAEALGARVHWGALEAVRGAARHAARPTLERLEARLVKRSA